MNNQNWFTNPCFDKYWESYSNAQNFAQNAFNPKDSKNIYKDYCTNFTILKQASILAHNAALNELSKLNSKNLEQKPRENKIKNGLEFEISEDLLEFYHESRKFKKEKKHEEKMRLKGLNDGSIMDYTSGEQINLEQHKYSKEAPLERVGLKREQELKLLYGEKVNSIHLLETKLQMRHDRNLDLYQPVYWPSFPLKL